MALAGVAVAVSRVMVGAHWPSDVLLGMAVGLGTVLAVLALMVMGPFAALWLKLARASATARGSSSGSAPSSARATAMNSAASARLAKSSWNSPVDESRMRRTSSSTPLWIPPGSRKIYPRPPH